MTWRWVIPTSPAHQQRDDELTPEQVLDILDLIGRPTPAEPTTTEPSPGGPA